MAIPKGYIMPQSTKDKISISNRGKKRTPEQLLAMSSSRIGNIPWNKGLTKYTDERVLKYSMSNSGRKVTQETKDKIILFWSSPRGILLRKRSSERMKGSKNSFFKIKDLDSWKKKVSHPGESNPWFGKVSPGIIAAINAARTRNKGKHLSESTKLKIGNSNRGRKHSEETRRKSSLVHKRWYENLSPEERHGKIRQLMLNLGRRRPTSIETKVNKILDNVYPNEFMYVGDGRILVEGKSPDFINCNGKKLLIEVFGNYWHSYSRTGRTKEEEENHRIDMFARYGFKTLVIWEDEIKDEVYLVNKISSFINGGTNEKSESLCSPSGSRIS